MDFNSRHIPYVTWSNWVPPIIPGLQHEPRLSVREGVVSLLQGQPGPGRSLSKGGLYSKLFYSSVLSWPVLALMVFLSTREA
jgi:hypothetical protein